MTFEQALLTALSVVTSALCYLAKLLWAKGERCEADRIELRIRLERLEGEKGEATGTLKAFENCPAPGCPFREAPKRSTTRIVLKPKLS